MKCIDNYLDLLYYLFQDIQYFVTSSTFINISKKIGVLVIYYLLTL